MVFGNKGDTSGSGVAFSRDEVTGAPEPSGDFLVNAQGEDVVSGVRNTLDIAELEDVMPEAHAELMEILRTLEAHYKDMQDTEFTIEEGRLYMLQTRNAKRPAQAAVRFAVDAVEEELLTKEEAIATIDAESLDALLHPTFDPGAEYDVLARGVAASPGAAKGEIVFTAADAVQAGEDGRDVILVRPFTEAEDVAGFHAARGILTERGRQGQPRRARRPRHGRARRHRRRPGDRPLRRRAARRRDDAAARATAIAIDGTTGIVTVDDVPLVEPEVGEPSSACSSGPTSCARSASAPTPTRPRTRASSREFGAEGIGLCRTEHMSSWRTATTRWSRSSSPATRTSRREHLDALLPLQQQDFEGLYEEMDGPARHGPPARPAAARVPPDRHEVEAEVERARVEMSDDLERLERTLERVRSLEEVNPMLGTRAVRLGAPLPRDLRDAGAGDHARGQRPSASARGHAPQLEVMVPLVDYERELAAMREMILDVGEREGARRTRPTTRSAR